jgi:cytochrome oxidase Cu insertion factor (SCO1/SenC/PrrC family)
MKISHHLVFLALLQIALCGCYRAKAPQENTGSPKPTEGLKVGKIAPEIVGEDIDGTAFKLSDYRGKVVLLDFWGHW